MTRTALAVSLSVLGAACGSGGISTVGSVASKSIDAHDGYLELGPQDPETLNQLAYIWIASSDEICLKAQRGTPINGTRLLGMALGIVNPIGAVEPADAAGQYEINPRTTPRAGVKVALAAFLDISACGALETHEAVSGLVTLHHVEGAPASPRAMRGEFDLRFSGGAIVGKFDVVLCGSARLSVQANCQ